MPDLDLAPHMARMKKKIGEANGPLVVKVEHGALLKFARAIGETGPLYTDEDYARTTRFGAMIAPPTYVSHWVTQLSEHLYDFETPGLRSLHTDDITENFLPIRVGDTISGTAVYADVWSKEGRNGPIVFQAVDTTLTNQDGARVAVIRMVAASFP